MLNCRGGELSGSVLSGAELSLGAELSGPEFSGLNRRDTLVILWDTLTRKTGTHKQ